MPVPVTAHSKAVGGAAARLLGLWVRILSGGGGHGFISLLNVVYCQV
jgi:hypothetical protein